MKRSEKIASLQLDYIANPEFEKIYGSQSEQSILIDFSPVEESPVETDRDSGRKSLTGIPHWFTAAPLLKREQEIALFKKYNFLKFKASKLRKTLNKRSPKVATMDEIEQLYDKAISARDQIISANTRLVISIAKKFVQGSITLEDLVSRCVSDSLMKAVEKFNCSCGYRFSTYATKSIENYLRRFIPNEKKHSAIKCDYCDSDNYDEDYYSIVDLLEDKRTDPTLREYYFNEVIACLDRLLSELPERDLFIIRRVYKLDNIDLRQTLCDIGNELGISDSRVQQIAKSAIEKLRKWADKNGITLPEYGDLPE